MILQASVRYEPLTEVLAGKKIKADREKGIPV